MTHRPWVIIGNPENRRVRCFQQALASRGQPIASVLSYESLLSGDVSLASLPQDVIVRLESPGENANVERLLIRAGVDPSQAEGSCVYDRKDLPGLPQEHGRILAPRQSYLGYVTTMRDWFANSDDSTDQTWTTTPEALTTQFDKALCQASCAQAGIPTPKRIGIISGWEELSQAMSDAGIERCFVKLANSSSASGVMAIHYRGNKTTLATSVELVQSSSGAVLYNSLKLKNYRDIADVKSLVDSVAKHRAYTEEWLPKASIARRVCDLRLLVIAGEPRHAVVRTSRSPITNLHLGNRRGDIDEFWQRISEEQQHELWKTCRRCAELFPGSLHLGLDILFTPGFRRHYLLEVNAFGDLLPNITHRGASTYEAQVDALTNGWEPQVSVEANNTRISPQ